MDGLVDHQLICRACLKIVENKTQSFGYIDDGNGNLKSMIMCCVPEMDIYVSSNPIICFPCIQLLVTVYNFKTRCLNTETIIRSYIERNNLTEYNQVNLSCVIQELIKLNKYFKDYQPIKHEIAQVHASTTENSQTLNQVKSDQDNYMAEMHEGDIVMNHQQEQMDECVNNVISENIQDETDNSISEGDVNNDWDVNNDIGHSDETQQESGTEKRPRLVIKICKNRITLPFQEPEQEAKECSNENHHMAELETEVTHPEMPPPEPLSDTKPELLQCPNCIFATVSINYYLSHMKTCEFQEKRCPYCPYITNRLYHLNRHINTTHVKLIWHTCEFCPYRTVDISCLRRHKRNIHPERLGLDLKCSLCTFRCSNEYIFKRHMAKHDVNGKLQCQFCSYSTRDRSNFRKHIFIHNPKPKGCEFCDYQCVSPYQMKLHLKKYHNGVGMEDVDCRSEVSINEVVEDISAAIKEAEKCAGHVIETK